MKAIDNKELVDNILELAIMCNDNDTDNCDLTICTVRGDIICQEDALSYVERFDIEFI